MITIAVLGLGSRGRNYGNQLARADGVTIAAVCDKYQVKIDNVANNWDVPKNLRFTDDNAFFKAGKLADAIIIATQDRDHFGHAMKALELGYNVLMEKPVSPNIEECLKIEKFAREKGLKVLVCHVLRYAPYYRKIKEIIESGVIGKVVEIRHSENISYWHFAHSYVRGNWADERTTSPMLLAKSCHDMDLLYWYTGSKFKSLSSYGDLKYFTAENAPEGATERCFDCPLKNKCKYEATYQYIGRSLFKLRKFKWGTYAFCPQKGKKNVLEALKNGERGKEFSRCVFHCDNNVVDNQCVLMEMQNGIKCLFSVNAFNENNHRHMEIRGTMGEIIADDNKSILTLKVFDKPTKKIHVNIIDLVAGHAGGDQGLIKALIAMLKGEPDSSQQYTWIRDTVESHRIVAAAEISRHQGGRRVSAEEIPDIEE